MSPTQQLMLFLLQKYISWRQNVNKALRPYDRFTILLYTLGAVFLYTRARKLHKFLQYTDLTSYVKEEFLKFGVRWIPAIRNKVAGEKAKVAGGFAEEFEKTLVRGDRPDSEEGGILPAASKKKEEVIELLKARAGADKAMWGNGRVSGAIYHGEDDLQVLLEKAYGEFTASDC